LKHHISSLCPGIAVIELTAFDKLEVCVQFLLQEQKMLSFVFILGQVITDCEDDIADSELERDKIDNVRLFNGHGASMPRKETVSASRISSVSAHRRRSPPIRAAAREWPADLFAGGRPGESFDDRKGR
jgi:hypothetical protein